MLDFLPIAYIIVLMCHLIHSPSYNVKFSISILIYKILFLATPLFKSVLTQKGSHHRKLIMIQQFSGLMSLTALTGIPSQKRIDSAALSRSEERRVGKECSEPC